MAEYRLTPAAENDLEEIWVYSLHHWSENQASLYLDQFGKAFSQIANRPYLSPSCDHIREGYRYKGVGRHIIYYRITDYGVAIIRVLHDRMDASKHC